MPLEIKPWVIDPTGASEGDVMVLVNGIFQFQAQSGGGYTEGARVYKNSDTTITRLTWTDLTFNQERYDTDNIHSTVANTDRLTCVTAGKYTIAFHARWESENAGAALAIYLNNTTWLCISQQNAGDYVAMSIATIYDLSVDDYVTGRVWHKSVGDEIIDYAFGSPEFMMQRTGDNS